MHTHFLLSLLDLIRVTGALPIGCESGPLLPRADNFPYSRADRKLWLSTPLRRDKEIFPLATHISLHHIFACNILTHLPFPLFLHRLFPLTFSSPISIFCCGLQLVSPLNRHRLLWWAGSFTSCGDICILWHNPGLCAWFTLSAYHRPLIAFLIIREHKQVPRKALPSWVQIDGKDWE